jgi:serine protease
VDAQGDHPVAGTRLEVFGCHGRENQRWTFQDRTGDSSSIVGIGGLCLDVIGGQTGDGYPLQLYPCGSQTNQGFRHFEDGRIRELQTGKCLTANGSQGAPLTIAQCDRNNAGQVWVLSQ